MSKVTDLTLAEMNEGERYNLKPQHYFELKQSILGNNQARITEEIRKQFICDEAEQKKELDKKIRPKIMDEVHDLILEKTRQEFTDSMRSELRNEIIESLNKEVPTLKQREAAREAARGTELDELAISRAASDMADTKEKDLVIDVSVRSGISHVLMYAWLPAIAAMHFELGWGMNDAKIYLIAFTWLIAIIVSFASMNSVRTDAEKAIKNFRSISLIHRKVALIAKRVSIIDIMTVQTRTEIQSALDKIGANAWNRESEETFIPAAEIEKARIRVKDELLIDIDPERYIRLDSEDVEETKNVSAT